MTSAIQVGAGPAGLVGSSPSVCDAPFCCISRAVTEHEVGPINQPYIITFRNGRSVKFHRYSLQEVVEKEGRTFDGFHHVDSP